MSDIYASAKVTIVYTRLRCSVQNGKPMPNERLYPIEYNTKAKKAHSTFKI